MQNLNFAEHGNSPINVKAVYAAVGNNKVELNEFQLDPIEFHELINAAVPKGVLWKSGDIWTCMFGYSVDKCANIDKKITRGGVELAVNYVTGPLYEPDSYQLSLLGSADLDEEGMKFVRNQLDYTIKQICMVGKMANLRANCIFAKPGIVVAGSHLTVIADANAPLITLHDSCRDVMILYVC